MSQDFSKPQRQSLIGIVVMLADHLRHMVRLLIAPIIITIVKLDKNSLGYAIGILLLLLLVTLIFSYLSFLKFTFYLDEKKQEFVVNKGVLRRTQLTVQLDKIQQVNINQNLLQKLIGIFGLHIDTAGSDGEEVSIGAITGDVARNLREHLLSRNSRTEPTSKLTISEPAHDTPILKLSPLTLLKSGVTSNYGGTIGLLIASSYSLYHTAHELIRGFNIDQDQVGNALTQAFFIFFDFNFYHHHAVSGFSH